MQLITACERKILRTEIIIDGNIQVHLAAEQSLRIQDLLGSKFRRSAQSFD